MDLDLQKVIEYEKIMPLCTQSLIGVMKGLDVMMRDDLTLICNLDYPSPDANMAFLLRATENTADSLINEVTEYFKAKGISPTVFISPACTPSDLSLRLLKQGYIRQEPDESWFVFEHLQAVRMPKTNPKIVVRQVEGSEVGLFAKVMAAAYEMPSEWVSPLVKVLEPSIGQPNFRHYLAFINQEPVATITIMRHENYAILGSAGALPEHRGSSLMHNLAVHVLLQARDEGVDTILLQTTLGPIFERFLRILGFKLAFKRTGYMLE